MADTTINIILKDKDGTRLNPLVADKSITADKLADKAVTADKLADKAVTKDKLADKAVTKDKLDESLQRRCTNFVVTLNGYAQTVNANNGGVTYGFDASRDANTAAEAFRDGARVLYNIPRISNNGFVASDAQYEMATVKGVTIMRDKTYIVTLDIRGKEFTHIGTTVSRTE